jgi:hypothetical protein
MHYTPTSRRPVRARFRLSVLALGLLACGASHAIDFGPFTLTGFAKVDVTRSSNQCGQAAAATSFTPDGSCQRFPNENRQRFWADEIVAGTEYGTKTTHITLMQPYLAAKFKLPRGFELSGLLSQRWRDGEFDIARNIYYEKNVAIAHEYYGRVAIGSFPTRSWALADYPYGSDIGVGDAWASSGAGYGLLGHAVRYTSPIMDFMEGDLVLEATYDTGASGWTRNNPWFVELYAQYIKGNLHLDLIYQTSRNGEPVSWGKAPFQALTFDKSADALLGGSGQSIAMLMARYQVTRQVKAFAGVRFNRWSGAYAVITQPAEGRGAGATAAQWNFMFNVDWGGTLDGVPNPGYPATSTDVSAGLTYTFGQWTASTGMVVLGKASTKNPSERGQSNSAVINNIGLGYDFRNGFQVSAGLGMVHYSELGLAPLSMPATTAFTGVDPRVAKRGNSFNMSATYTF